MAVQVVRIGHMGMAVLHQLMLVPMAVAVWAAGRWIFLLSTSDAADEEADEEDSPDLACRLFISYNNYSLVAALLSLPTPLIL